MVTVTNNASDILTITRAVEPCPASYTATTQTQVAYSFQITGGFTSVITQIDSAKNLNDRKVDLNNKLDSVGGLRTGMGASLQVTEIDATGAEVKKSITS